MENVMLLMTCEDGSCCCLPLRNAAALISLLSLMASLIDCTSPDPSKMNPMREDVLGMKTVLIGMFQLANGVLLLAAFIESAFLVKVYVLHTIGFVLFALCLSLVELLTTLSAEGEIGRSAALLGFASQVVFIFVISRCLPLMNEYKRQLENDSATQMENIGDFN